MASAATMFERIPRYVGFSPLVPVYQVSRPDRPTIHRFYDTSPMSPSGRYIGLTEFPYEDRLPQPGEFASVVVLDLMTGEEVYRTRTEAWDTQVGAHVQWGRSDNELLFNRMSEDSDRGAFGVRVDPFSHQEFELDGPVYMSSPDGSLSLSPHLESISIVQRGYGGNLPDCSALMKTGVCSDDGVYITNNRTGESSLLLSFADIVNCLPSAFSDLDPRDGAFYGFHVKWNPQGDRVMFILRWRSNRSRGGTKNHLVTFRPDGTDVNLALHWKQWRLGHHPNWCPDGEHIIMNLSPLSLARQIPRISHVAERLLHKAGMRVYMKRTALRFVSFRYDGTEFNVLCPDHYGSGHPTISPEGKYILTDAYPTERVSFGDGSVPLRLIDIATGEVRAVVRMLTKPVVAGPQQELRVDPHPAWHPTRKLVAFNGCPDGVRQVFVADFSHLLAD